ncbi:MAG: 50S ribosomal protein L29 [Candidatus Micrarchaeota archaeon]|nr:50S ribosomal protein L29 [Candidatus Micrarchaeota archaeon]
MAVLRIKEIREMDDKALKEKVYQLQAELVKENSNSRRSGKNINTGRIKELRKAIARLLTVLKERGAS